MLNRVLKVSAGPLQQFAADAVKISNIFEIHKVV